MMRILTTVTVILFCVIIGGLDSSKNLTALKTQNISIVPSPTQHILKQDKVGKATNSSLSQNLSLEKMVNQTRRSIDELSSRLSQNFTALEKTITTDSMFGLLGVVFGASGIVLAISIPYAYEKWKEPLLEIRIPEYDPLVRIEGMCMR
jgi:hypothetical protein